MKRARCPICGKLLDPKHLPFCSSRCADIDLQRWLSGRYVVPGSEVKQTPRPADDDD